MGAHFMRAMVLMQQSRHDLAAQELRQELASDPGNAAAHAMLGVCLARQEKYSEASAETEAAIRAAPDSPLAHYAHASVLHDRNRLPEALAAVREAIRIDPESADSHSLLAQIQYDLRRWQDALNAAEEGLALDPQHVDCANLRALALQSLGRLSQATVTTESALARAPESATTHAVHGLMLLSRRQPEEAMGHFREALRLDPESGLARQGVVEALKARNFVYRWMLVYFLWAGRLSRGAQWGLMIGGYVGYRVLGAVAESHPALAPWIMPLLVVYVVFALLTWLAYPLFNLALRLHPLGKFALNADQIRGANWTGVWLLISLVPLVCWMATGNLAWLLLALNLGLCLMPLSAIHRCDAGWPRWAMTGYTAVLVLLGLLIAVPLVLVSTFPETLPDTLPPDAPPSLIAWRLFYGLTFLLRGTARLLLLIGIIGSAFVANYLSGVRPRK